MPLAIWAAECYKKFTWIEIDEIVENLNLHFRGIPVKKGIRSFGSVYWIPAWAEMATFYAIIKIQAFINYFLKTTLHFQPSEKRFPPGNCADRFSRRIP